MKGLAAIIAGIRTLLLTLVLMGFTQYTVADYDSPYLQIKRMTMETTNAIAAVLEGRKQGIQATATVVDKNGIVQAVVRGTLTPAVSITVSRSKAYTSYLSGCC